MPLGKQSSRKKQAATETRSKKKQRAFTPPPSPEQNARRTVHRVTPLLLGCIAVFLGFCLYSDTTGELFGDLLRMICRGLYSYVSYALPPLLLLLALTWRRDVRNDILAGRLIFAQLALLLSSAAVYTYGFAGSTDGMHLGDMFHLSAPVCREGGWIGNLLGTLIDKSVGALGMTLILITFAVVYLVLYFRKGWLYAAIGQVRRRKAEATAAADAALDPVMIEPVTPPMPAGRTTPTELLRTAEPEQNPTVRPRRRFDANVYVDPAEQTPAPKSSGADGSFRVGQASAAGGADRKNVLRGDAFFGSAASDDTAPFDPNRMETMDFGRYADRSRPAAPGNPPSERRDIPVTDLSTGVIEAYNPGVAAQPESGPMQSEKNPNSYTSLLRVTEAEDGAAVGQDEPFNTDVIRRMSITEEDTELMTPPATAAASSDRQPSRPVPTAADASSEPAENAASPSYHIERADLSAARSYGGGTPPSPAAAAPAASAFAAANASAAPAPATNASAAPAPAAAAKPNPRRPYLKPPFELLTPFVPVVDSNANDEIQTNAQNLVNTLANFNVKVTVTNVVRGPRITRYEIVPDAGVRVRTIANLADDIAMNLASEGISIEAPIPGKAAVGVNVPNRNPSMVRLRNIIDTDQFRDAKAPTTVCIGAMVTGEPVYADLAKMPHLLIAGATGMGKSVCINTLITSLLYKASPDELKLILVDPKKVELNTYREIPHLLIPVVTDPKKAAGALSWAVNEMERRFTLIEKSGYRDIQGYNRNAEERVPSIVIVIDELADLMMSAPDSVESSIARIAQKARAAGIHLVIGTQRPSVDVITGLIKANIPSRIAFKTASNIDSRTILDSVGAERLLNNGDMLFAPTGYLHPLRVQGAFISDDEVHGVTDFLRENAGTDSYDTGIMQDIDREAERCTKSKKGGDDEQEEGSGDLYDILDNPQFCDAVDVAFSEGTIATSRLQRRLSIGYGKAAKYIDAMYAMGIVSEADGAKPRELLMSREQFYLLLEQHGH